MFKADRETRDAEKFLKMFEVEREIKKTEVEEVESSGHLSLIAQESYNLKDEEKLQPLSEESSGYQQNKLFALLGHM